VFNRGKAKKTAKNSNSESAAISITSAPIGLTQDQSARARRYFISMMIRTGCFVLTIFLPSPYRWFALLAAVLLPYISVVVANAGRENPPQGSALMNETQKSIE
jgi:hypothetical protein